MTIYVKVLVEWQIRRKEVITHPFLKEKVEWECCHMYELCCLLDIAW